MADDRGREGEGQDRVKTLCPEWKLGRFLLAGAKTEVIALFHRATLLLRRFHHQVIRYPVRRQPTCSRFRIEFPCLHLTTDPGLQIVLLVAPKVLAVPWVDGRLVPEILDIIGAAIAQGIKVVNLSGFCVPPFLGLATGFVRTIGRTPIEERCTECLKKKEIWVLEFESYFYMPVTYQIDKSKSIIRTRCTGPVTIQVSTIFVPYSKIPIAPNRWMSCWT
jgi:hypothetical protein